MANMTLDDLRNQLSGLEEYVPEDEATLRQRAIDIYSPQYQQDLNMLRNQIEFQAAQQQRNAVKTGMQRSSYNQAQQASIRRGGLQSEAQLASSYDSNIANLLYQMIEGEKDRKNAADQYRNSLLLQLYGMQPKGGGGNSTLQTLLSKFGSGVAKGANTFLSGLGLNNPNGGANTTVDTTTGGSAAADLKNRIMPKNTYPKLPPVPHDFK